MRYPHKRMPVVGLGCCERPFYAPPSQPILHIDVVSDIEVIVKGNKIVIEHLPIDRQSRSGEEKKDNDSLQFIRRHLHTR